jgi:hypothetical protein
VCPPQIFPAFIGYNNMQQEENSAVSSYNALQFNYRHAFSHGLTLQTTYTWSHAIDDSTSTYQQNGGAVDGNFNLSRWRATSDLHRTHILQINDVYDLPFFKNSSPLLKGALGGWEISGIASFFTGQPVNFNCTPKGFSTGIGTSARCDTVGNVAVHKSQFVRLRHTLPAAQSGLFISEDDQGVSQKLGWVGGEEGA